jgi:two-component system sensor histidine kinase VicK
MKHLASEAEKYIDGANTNHVKTYVKLLNENSNRCIEIINDLMKQEHVQSPNISIKKTRIDIVSKIKMIYDEVRQSYLDRQFVMESSAESIYVSVDDVKLLQVVNNFISNSIKYTHPHQPITVRITEKPDEVLVSVEDTGIGIPDKLKPFVFNRQGGAGRTGLNGEKSIGLGLWICKTLIEMMDGEIGFESTEGKGSNFYFRLPKE